MEKSEVNLPIDIINFSVIAYKGVSSTDPFQDQNITTKFAQLFHKNGGYVKPPPPEPKFSIFPSLKFSLSFQWEYDQEIDFFKSIQKIPPFITHDIVGLSNIFKPFRQKIQLVDVYPLSKWDTITLKLENLRCIENNGFYDAGINIDLTYQQAQKVIDLYNDIVEGNQIIPKSESFMLSGQNRGRTNVVVQNQAISTEIGFDFFFTPQSEIDKISKDFLDQIVLFPLQ